MLPLTLSVTPLTNINQPASQTPLTSPTGNTSTSLPIEDIHLPQSINLWPPAVGWWALMLLFVISIYYLYRFSQKKIRQYKQYWGYRKSALRLLEQCYKEHNTKNKAGNTIKNNQMTTNAILRLLKRTAISAYPEYGIKALYGEAWIKFLNSCTTETYFHDEIITLFDEKQYQKKENNISGNEDIDTLYHAVKQWIKQHHSSNNLNKQDAKNV